MHEECVRRANSSREREWREGRRMAGVRENGSRESEWFEGERMIQGAGYGSKGDSRERGWFEGERMV